MAQFNHKKFTKAFLDKKFSIEFEKKEHLSLRDLSKEVGVSASTLSRLTYGRNMDIDSILSVCKWLGKEIGDFIK